ncbi:MAG: formate dehydrogenase subunit alpha [Methanosarcinaceae archaeon]|nr:formate dehydrogenase subunit alpha [Methanosarcinaceae archaeon]
MEERSLHPSICPYCSVGCGFYIELEKGRPVGIRYMPEHPVNEGALCPKGNAALEILTHPERLTHPLRKSEKGWEKLSWNEALDTLAEKIREVRGKAGPEALAFLGSAKCSNEENYLLQKIARMLGTNNVDNCARLCHASTITGLGKTLGAGAMTNPLSDLAHSECIFVVGSNFAENHPPVARRVLQAKDRGASLIVADPRLTPSAWLSDLTLRLRPGTDIALINGLMQVILAEGLEDRVFIRKRTVGIEGLEKALKKYTPKTVSRITGVPAGDIIKAARTFAKAETASVVYSMGITQHVSGTDNVTACADLALLCGHLGKKGAGILPLRGQNNVQGACDMGVLAEFFPGYVKTDRAGNQEWLKKAWGLEKLPEKKGLVATEMVDAVFGGSLKFAYIMGRDPVNSTPNASKLKKALDSLDFLVVQDIFLTDSAKHADLVLPAAAWAEKEGSFTSTERRIQWVERTLVSPGDAKPDLEILIELANRLGLDATYKEAGDVLAEIARTVPAYGGLSKERLKEGCGLIWPCPDALHPGTPILHTESFSTPNGLASFVPVEFLEPAEPPDSDYPFLLITGRTGLHYNAGSMSRRSEALLCREPELYVELNPADAEALALEAGTIIVIETRRGRTEAKARLTQRVDRGVLFMPFHFPGTNLLTADALDRESKIPGFKGSACRIWRR